MSSAAEIILQEEREELERKVEILRQNVHKRILQLQQSYITESKEIMLQLKVYNPFILTHHLFNILSCVNSNDLL